MKRTEQKERTRENIRIAALALFQEKGIDMTTIQEITERAGVAKGTFFYHFDSKETVMFELQQMWVTEELQRLIAQPDVPVLQSIQLMSEMVALRTHHSHGLMRSILQTCLTDGPVRERHLQLLSDTAKLLAQWLENGQKSNEVTQEISAEKMGEQLVNVFFGSIFIWAMGDSKVELRTVTGEAVSLLIRSFRVG